MRFVNSIVSPAFPSLPVLKKVSTVSLEDQTFFKIGSGSRLSKFTSLSVNRLATVLECPVLTYDNELPGTSVFTITKYYSDARSKHFAQGPSALPACYRNISQCNRGV
jgi:hypothetical protein